MRYALASIAMAAGLLAWLLLRDAGEGRRDAAAPLAPSPAVEVPDGAPAPLDAREAVEPDGPGARAALGPPVAAESTRLVVQVLGPDEEPVGGALVRATWGSEAGERRTAADGRASFLGPPEGSRLVLEAQAEGYLTLVEGQGVAPLVTLRLHRAAPLAGRVLHGETHVPIPGARVRIPSGDFDPDEVGGEATSGPDGTYRFGQEVVERSREAAGAPDPSRSMSSWSSPSGPIGCRPPGDGSERFRSPPRALFERTGAGGHRCGGRTRPFSPGTLFGAEGVRGPRSQRAGLGLRRNLSRRNE